MRVQGAPFGGLMQFFYEMQVVFYKSAHFMYLLGINSVFAKCALQFNKVLK